MDTTTVASLSVGDVLIDADGVEMRVDNKETSGRFATLALVPVAADPVNTPAVLVRMSVNAMVRVA